MKEVLKSLADFVFRFETFMFLMVVGFLYFVMTFVVEEADRRVETARITGVCYSQGMVLVDTDAGQRCADPGSLVKVK